MTSPIGKGTLDDLWRMFQARADLRRHGYTFHAPKNQRQRRRDERNNPALRQKRHGGGRRR